MQPCDTSTVPTRDHTVVDAVDPPSLSQRDIMLWPPDLKLNGSEIKEMKIEKETEV